MVDRPAENSEKRDVAGFVRSLEPGDRALLDLTIRRGLPDSEVSDLVDLPEADVRRRRETMLAQISERAVANTGARDRLERTLRELGDDVWLGESASSAASGRRKSAEALGYSPLLSESHPGQRRVNPRVWKFLIAILVVVVIAGAVIAIAGGGGSEPSKPPPPKSEANSTVTLSPIPGMHTSGSVMVRCRGLGKLTITTKGLSSPGDGVYTVWLYDSIIDSKRLGSFGNSGSKLTVSLPTGAERFANLDISRESSAEDVQHSGVSVFRAPLASFIAESGGCAQSG